MEPEFPLNSMGEDEKELDELDDGFESDGNNPNAFKIRNLLSPPVAQMYTTQQLHSYIHEGLIDVSPPYQRDVVWPESKQIHLIDSIFRNVYLPPILFSYTKDDEGEEIRVCVDGKQRLTSIQKFFDGQIPYKDPKTKKCFWYTLPESYRGTRLEVPEFYKGEFARKSITCVEYRNLPQGVERDIFQRVQLGMSLTAAEKLQAIDSAWAAWISELETRHVRSDNGLALKLQWDTKRGRDFQCIAQFVYCCDGLPQHLNPTSTKLENWLRRVDPPSAEFKTQMNSVLNSFWKIATTPGLNHAFSKIEKRVAPIEFVFVGVLLFVLAKLPLEARAEAIYRMRMHIRELFRDIRANTVVCSALWAFVEGVADDPTRYHVGSQGGSRGKKRRKGAEEDEEEEEYRPTPIKILGSPLKTRAKAHKS